MKSFQRNKERARFYLTENTCPIDFSEGTKFYVNLLRLVCFSEPLKVSVYQHLSRMEKLEYRAVIKFLQFVGKTPSGIKAELDSVYEDATLLLTTVKT